MKKLLFIIGIAAIIMVTFYTSFESALPQAGVRQIGKQAINQSKTILPAEIISVAQKDKMASEWKQLWISSENQLAQNENILSALKQKIENRDKTFDELYPGRIGELEDRNELLRVKLETYDISEGHWELYKKQFKVEMDKLIQDLENITLDYHY